VQKILKLGVEKVVFNSAAFRNPTVVKEASRRFGAQAIVASIDVRRKIFGRYEVFVDNGKTATGVEPVEYAKRMEACGAGEILLGSIDRDGLMQGYDTDIIARVSHAVSIPVIASGGAGSVADFKAAVSGGAAAVAAGAMFVFQGPRRAVLITYPERRELEAALG
jgi:cyclase